VQIARYYVFGWEIRGALWSFACNLQFPRSEREPIGWGVSLYARDRREKEKLFPLSQFSDAKGIRQDWMLKTLIHARQWRVSTAIRQSRKRRKR
jgi:hypothetical protein